MAPASEMRVADVTTTTPLLNRFLLLAVLWMAMAAFAAMAVEGPPLAADTPVKIIE